MLRGKPSIPRWIPKAGVFVFQNFAMSVPNTKKNIEFMRKLEYVVVNDTHMSETAELADIVVPGFGIP